MADARELPHNTGEHWKTGMQLRTLCSYHKLSTIRSHYLATAVTRRHGPYQSPAASRTQIEDSKTYPFVS